jgi:amino-acid N-acetyltransferase
MEYVEPPPERRPDEKEPQEKFRKVLKKPKEDSRVVIQKAQIGDVEEILELVNGFAASNLMLPRGPQYLYENIRDFVIAIDENIPVYTLTDTKEVMNLLVACGSLHVLWEDIAEVRALSIHPDYQHLGLGSRIVEFMEDEARKIGIHRLFTFTMTEDFFKALGFHKINRKDLPPKVWGECSRCPKYFQCDEVGMVLDL